MKRYSFIRSVPFVLLVACCLTPLTADVVIFESGVRQEGIVTPAPADPDAIMFQQISGTIKIPRSQIREIEQEPDSVDWLRLGDQYFSAKRYVKAQEAYTKSQQLGNTADVAERLEAVEAALQREASVQRRADLARLDDIIDSIARNIEEEKYAIAQALLTEEMPEVEPAPAQQDRLIEVTKRLYRAWGLDREDKMDSGTAARYYQKYLELAPEDEEIYRRLISIWERDPDKTQQVIAAHEIQLKAHPDDHVTRRRLTDKYMQAANQMMAQLTRDSTDAERDEVRKETARIYAKALEEYKTLYTSTDVPQPAIRERIVGILRTLVERAKRDRDYDQAIALYQDLQEYDPRADMQELNRMRFRRDALETSPDNVERRVELALRLRSQGDHTLALQELNRLRDGFPENEKVLGALKLYAEELHNEMLQAWSNLRYEQAQQLAMQLENKYGYVEGMGEEATRIKNLVAVELAKEAKQRTEQAMKFKEQGDQYYARAEQYYYAMLDTDRQSRQYQINDKNEAIRLYRRAIEQYEKAENYGLRLEPAARDALNANLSDARRKLNRLTTTDAIRGPRTPRDIGRD